MNCYKNTFIKNISMSCLIAFLIQIKPTRLLITNILFVILILGCQNFQIHSNSFISDSNKNSKILKQSLNSNKTITNLDYIVDQSFSNNQILNKTVNNFNRLNLCYGNQNKIYYTDSDDIAYTFYTCPSQTKLNSKKPSVILHDNFTYTVNTGNFNLSFQFKWKKRVLNTNNITFGLGYATVSSQDIFYNVLVNKTLNQKGQITDINIQLLNPQSISVSFNATTFQYNIYPSSNPDDVKNIGQFLSKGTWQTQSILSSLKNIINQEIPKSFLKYFKQQRNPFASKISYFYKAPHDYYGVYINMTKIHVILDAKEVGQDLKEIVFVYGYMMQIQSFQQSVCEGLDVQKLVQRQILSRYNMAASFTSYCFYQYVFKYALSKDIIDNNILFQDFRTKIFLFQKQDLLLIIPQIAQISDKSLKSVGNQCKVDQSNFKISQSPTPGNLFQLQIKSNCKITLWNSDRDSIDVQLIQIYLKMDIKSRYLDSYVDLYIDSLKQLKIGYKQIDNFVVTNKELADKVIKYGLEQLYVSKTFGSRWFFNQKIAKPVFQSLEKQLLVYDQLQ